MDNSLFRRVNELSANTAWAHPLMRAFAKYGLALFAVLCVWAWWVGRRDAEPRIVAAALWAPAACVLALLLAQPIVHAVNRERPYVRNPDAVVLVDRTTDPTFPSDHSTISGAAAGALWFTRRRSIRVAAILLALAMAAGRVYAGVHYPGDVVGGLAFGATVGLLGGWLVVPFLGRLVERLGTTALRPLLTSRAQAPQAPRAPVSRSRKQESGRSRRGRG